MATLEIWGGTKTFFSPDNKYRVEHFAQPPLYSYLTKYIGINYISIGSFVRVSNVKTGKILGYTHPNLKSPSVISQPYLPKKFN